MKNSWKTAAWNISITTCSIPWMKVLRSRQKSGAPFDFMLEKKAKGLVKHVGFSFHDKAEVLDKILTRHPEMEYVQLQLNYADWEDSEVQSRKCYEVCVKYGKPVLVMEPIKGGMLANVPAEAEALLKGRQTGNVCGILGHPFCCIPGKCIYGTERYER